MIETYVRSIYQYLFVDPIAKLIYQRFSAYQITYLGCLIGITVLPALLLGLPTLASFFLLISGYLDTLDGTVARFSKTSSPTGTVIDIISDRIVEFATIVGLFSIDPLHRSWLCLMILGSCFICVTSFLVVGIFLPNQSTKGFYYSPGLIERAEAFIFFLAMIWLPNYFTILAITFSLLVISTAYIRVKQFIFSQKKTFYSQF